jgi:hypothetical protein
MLKYLNLDLNLRHRRVPLSVRTLVSTPGRQPKITGFDVGEGQI